MPDECPLIERDSELAALTTALTGGDVVALEGAPGIGKTRLIHAALASPAFRARPVLYGHARPGSTAYPLSPVIEALATAKPHPAGRLSPITGVLREILPDHADLLPQPPPPVTDPRLAQHRLLRALTELLRQIGPAVLVVEDLQWADQVTLDLIGMLTATTTPLSILVSYRACDVAPADHLAVMLSDIDRIRHLSLGPLSPDGTGQLAGYELHSGERREPSPPVSPALAELLWRRTGGIPRLIQLDVRQLRHHGMLRRTDSGWVFREDDPGDDPWSRLASLVPSEVAWDVARRVDRLDPDSRQVLEAVAVHRAGITHAIAQDAGMTPAVARSAGVTHAAAHDLDGADPTTDRIPGAPAEVTLIGAVTGFDPDTVARAIAELARVGLLVDSEAEITSSEAGSVRFPHLLAEHAAYQAIPTPRRRRWHATIASTLATYGPATAAYCAVHHDAAGDLAAWAAATETAAAHAMAAGHYAAAYRLLRRIPNRYTASPRRALALASQLGWAALASGAAGDEATTALAAAPISRSVAGSAATTVDVRLAAEVKVLRCWLRLEQPDPRAWSDRLEQPDPAGDPIAPGELSEIAGRASDHPEIAAMAIMLLTWPSRFPQLPLTEQVSLLRTAQTELGEVSTPLVVAAIRSATIACRMASGDTEAWRLVDQLPAPSGDVRVGLCALRGLVHAVEGALFCGQYARAYELAERGLRWATQWGVARYQPELRALRQRAGWVMGKDTDVGTEPVTPGRPAGARMHHHLVIGAALAAGGRLDHARKLLHTTAEQSLCVGQLDVAASAVAEIWHSGAPAHQLTSAVLTAIATKDVWLWAAPLLPFADLSVLDQTIRACRARSSSVDAPLLSAAVSYAEARVAEATGDPAQAARHYAIAQRRYAALPDPRMTAHATTGEARCRLASGESPHPGVADLLRRAWRGFIDLGAIRDADRVKQVYRQAGLPVPHRRGRRGYGNRLSPREQEVVPLAAEGHTNRDIAARLYLSERTVKYHLGNAMRKLGVTSRRQLATAARSASHPDGAAAESNKDAAGHLCRCQVCGRILTGN